MSPERFKDGERELKEAGLNPQEHGGAIQLRRGQPGHLPPAVPSTLRRCRQKTTADRISRKPRPLLRTGCKVETSRLRDRRKILTRNIGTFTSLVQVLNPRTLAFLSLCLVSVKEQSEERQREGNFLFYENTVRNYINIKNCMFL